MSPHRSRRPSALRLLVVILALLPALSNVAHAWQTPDGELSRIGGCRGLWFATNDEDNGFYYSHSATPGLHSFPADPDNPAETEFWQFIVWTDWDITSDPALFDGGLLSFADTSCVLPDQSLEGGGLFFAHNQGIYYMAWPSVSSGESPLEDLAIQPVVEGRTRVFDLEPFGALGSAVIAALVDEGATLLLAVNPNSPFGWGSIPWLSYPVGNQGERFSDLEFGSGGLLAVGEQGLIRLIELDGGFAPVRAADGVLGTQAAVTPVQNFTSASYNAVLGQWAISSWGGIWISESVGTTNDWVEAEMLGSVNEENSFLDGLVELWPFIDEVIALSTGEYVAVGAEGFADGNLVYSKDGAHWYVPEGLPVLDDLDDQHVAAYEVHEAGRGHIVASLSDLAWNGGEHLAGTSCELESPLDSVPGCPVEQPEPDDYTPVGVPEPHASLLGLAALATLAACRRLGR